MATNLMKKLYPDHKEAIERNKIIFFQGWLLRSFHAQKIAIAMARARTYYYNNNT